MIQLVFATTDEGHFGADKGMPWRHISQDFKNFKARTKDSVLVMGAKTFMSLPTKLKDREHYVIFDHRPGTDLNLVAKDGSVPDFEIQTQFLGQYLGMWEYKDKMYSIIGGAELLKTALPYADRVIKTEIWDDYDHAIVTQSLNDSFLFELETEWVATETHYYRISPYTQIEESVLIKAEKLEA